MIALYFRQGFFRTTNEYALPYAEVRGTEIYLSPLRRIGWDEMGRAIFTKV